MLLLILGRAGQRLHGSATSEAILGVGPAAIGGAVPTTVTMFGRTGHKAAEEIPARRLYATVKGKGAHNPLPAQCHSRRALRESRKERKRGFVAWEG